MFETTRLPVDRNKLAFDGSDVRVLLTIEKRGGMAHFELGPGQTSRALVHKTVGEIWFVLGGRGEMWRKEGDQDEVIAMEPGVCLSIPVGTHFQFRSFGYEPLAAIAITMPPWPNDNEPIAVLGKWTSTIGETP